MHETLSSIPSTAKREKNLDFNPLNWIWSIWWEKLPILHQVTEYLTDNITMPLEYISCDTYIVKNYISDFPQVEKKSRKSRNVSFYQNGLAVKERQGPEPPGGQREAHLISLLDSAVGFMLSVRGSTGRRRRLGCLRWRGWWKLEYNCSLIVEQ